MWKLSGWTLVTALAWACTSPGELEFREFVIEVETVEAPTSAAHGETIRVRLLGIIGPDLCHTVSRVRREELETPPGIQITAYGRVAAKPDGCPGAIAKLDYEVILPAPDALPFEIRVRQPDGSTLFHTVEPLD